LLLVKKDVLFGLLQVFLNFPLYFCIVFVQTNKLVTLYTCRHAAGYVVGADWRVGCCRCCRTGQRSSQLQLIPKGQGSRIRCVRLKKVHRENPENQGDMLVRIRILESVPLTNGSGSGFCSFRRWPSRCKQKIIVFFLSFFAYYFLKEHLHSSQIKSHKEVTKQ
jgi:hypothetical protein